MINRIVLDVQHMGKPHNPFDRGAVNKEHDLIEADLCLEYASLAHKALTKRGLEPFLITSGYYRDRAKFANYINADLYIACHVNSFHGELAANHGLVEISELAGTDTKKIASEFVSSLLLRSVVKDADTRIIKKNERGWSCISRVKAPAILFEPIFISHPELLGYSIMSNLWNIAGSIVTAVESFNRRV